MNRYWKALFVLPPAGLLCWALGTASASDPIPVANEKISVAKQDDAKPQSEKTNVAKQDDAKPQNDADIKQVGMQPVQPPAAPTETPTAAPTPTAPAARSLVPNLDSKPDASASQQIQNVAATPSSTYIAGEQSVGLASTDAGDLLSKSASATGVSTQKRSPIVNESHIRGFNLGQMVTQSDGVYWLPARPDLDTFLSKIDSGEIKDLVVVKGPYTALFGPGFAFIDIETNETPRSSTESPEYHGRTVFNYNTNGQGFYGRQDVSVAGPWWGINVTYGQRLANDYTNGQGFDIPSQYDSRDLALTMGFNINANNKVEFGYLRLDQTDLLFPGQVFETKYLGTNGFRTRFSGDDASTECHYQTDAFWNRTVLTGITTDANNELFPVLASIGPGFTDANQSSGGFRSQISWGHIDKREVQFTTGVDLRYLEQELNEYISLGLPTGFGLPNNPIPPSYESNLGLFAECAVPLGDKWTLKVGGRLDWTQADVMRISDGFTGPEFWTQQNDDYFGVTGNSSMPDLQKDFGMWMLFATADCKVNDHWSVNFGVSHAERPPTTTELYAMNPFVALLQNGATTVLGNPELRPEEMVQLDTGTKVQFEVFRAGANAHISFIRNYITYVERPSFESASNPAINTVQFENTDLAILAGGEFFTELDVTGWLTTFGTLSYVAGLDTSRTQLVATTERNPNSPNGLSTTLSPSLNNAEEPLPMMPPLEARIGIRVHEPRADPRYGAELGVRIDAAQNMVASSLFEQPTSGFNVWDLRAYWHVVPRWTVTGGIENIFSRTYRESYDLLTGATTGNNGQQAYGFYRPGFNAYLGTELKY